MAELTKSEENKQKLEVASRACTTLSKNIFNLEEQMNSGSSVSENEVLLDEIRTITALFSDIMQDYILSEIEYASHTNALIKRASIIITVLQFVILLCSILISLSGYFAVSRSIQKPLNDMQNMSTQIAKGNLAARIKDPSVKELKPLAQNLNQMAEQIDLLIKKNIEEQTNFQKAEMKALQAQITPHFLYNTFDTIIWLAEQEDTERVVTITKAFSEFLRISLSRGHEWITIQQELDHIKHYLTIQKIRYADILTYEINANEDLLHFKTIKLCLQPLVENAIYHGIKNRRGRGKLSVNICYTDDSKSRIKFSVTDNGAGFSEERLSQVLNELKTDSKDSESLTSVYGLYNVHKKLQLYYGKETEGLKIQSVPNSETTISFEIPCLTGEQNV